MTLTAVILATLLLGFAPPIVWLWFWLKEDVHPEPKSEIALVFCMGMAMVLVAFIAENLFMGANRRLNDLLNYSPTVFYLFNVFGFALIEELAKTAAAFMTALRSRYFDEPIDAMIYVITASLGFAAFENALFISQSATTTLSQTVIISAFRFANAILIHAATGAIIGASFAFSFCSHSRRAVELAIALGAATLLHAAYNFYILSNEESDHQLVATIIVGVGAVIALILFERAKRLRALCD